MSRTNRAASGFLTSLLQYATQILVQVLLAPVVLRLAGREALGAFAAIMQTLTFLGLVDIVHSWTLERFLAQSAGLDDGGARFRKVFTTARTLILISNSVFALLVLGFSTCVAWLFSLSPAIASQAQDALYVIAAWAVLRTPLAAYLNASVATQDMAATNMIGALLGVSRTLASLLFVLTGAGLLGLMLAGTVVEACGSFLYRVRFKRRNPDLMPGWGIPDKPLLREMLGFGGHAMFLNIGNMLVFNSGNTIAGMTNGAAMASVFYTSQMPTMTAYNMVLRLADSAMPGINDIFGRGDLQRLKHAIARLVRFMLMLAAPLALGVWLFNRDLVVTWVGEDQYAGALLTDTLAVFCVTLVVQRVAIVCAFVCGWMRLLTATAIVQGIAHFSLAFYLGKTLGLGGITLSLLAVTLPQIVVLWRKASQTLGLNVLGVAAECAWRLLLPLLCAGAAGLTVHSLVSIQPKHYSALLTELAAFALTYGALAYFTVPGEDRKDLNAYLKGFTDRGLKATRALTRAFGGAG